MSRRKAFTLVELLVSLAVLSALLVPIFLIFQMTTKTIYRSTNDILAASLAMAKIEELKSLPFFKLENILLGLHPDDPYRLNQPPTHNMLTGPYEATPELPDIQEPNFYRAGSTVFHRYTYLSYFPQANPSPSANHFEKQKKRIRIRTQIFWKDRLSGSVFVDQHLTFESMVHDENYNPRPQFNQFFAEGGGP